MIAYVSLLVTNQLLYYTSQFERLVLATFLSGLSFLRDRFQFSHHPQEF